MKKGFSKNFYLVVIGQIISLFGNAVIRFALPLHLLSVTGSAALLGVVSGVAFLPLVVMSPIGGLIADRMNKRNIMVVLDFFTAGLVLLFLVLSGRGSLVSLILIMLFLLYGISGAYQPSVQASIPLLVSEEAVMPANAIINMVSSLSGLLGPALGGIAYGLWGITPILYVCMGCFFLSAVMEIFIHIPFVKRVRTDTLLHETIADMKSSLIFIGREKKEIGKLTFLLRCGKPFPIGSYDCQPACYCYTGTRFPPEQCFGNVWFSGSPHGGRGTAGRAWRRAFKQTAECQKHLEAAVLLRNAAASHGRGSL